MVHIKVCFVCIWAHMLSLYIPLHCFHHGGKIYQICHSIILCFTICVWCYLITTIQIETSWIILKFYLAYCKYGCSSILFLILVLASVKLSKLSSVIKQNYVINQLYKSKLYLAIHSMIRFCANFFCTFFMGFQENISLGSEVKMQ